MNDIEFIKSCAARGCSKSHTAQLFGVYPEKFSVALQLLDAENIQFVDGSHSLLAQEARRKSAEKRRGKPQTWLTEDDIDRLAKRMKAWAKIYVAFGMEGTLPDLVKRFGKVDDRTVRRRISLGMPIELALSTPPRGRAAFLGIKKTHPWRRGLDPVSP